MTNLSLREPKKMDQPGYFIRYKHRCLRGFEKATMPQYAQGLNILVAPNDFDVRNLEKYSGVSEQVVSLENPKNIKIYEEPTIESEIYFQEFLDDKWEMDNSKLDYFNNLYADKTLLIVVPREAVATAKIMIDYKLKKGLISKLFILLEENTEADIIITKSGAGNYAAEDIRIVAHDNSKLSMLNFQNFSKETINFETNKIYEGKNAEITLTDIAIGSEFTRSETTSWLNGINASIDHKILFLTKNQQQKDLYSCAVHNAEKTNSNLATRGALKDGSKALSRSLIIINENAPHSSGSEQQDSIILDAEAEADAIPKLEIRNPNVKCRHGSTIGQIDEEKIFYLMSRGLDIEAAKRKIVEGFFNTFIKSIKNKEAAKKIGEIISVNLK